MSNELSRLFDQLESLTVGFGPVFRDFQTPTSNYPPHNIVRVSDNEFFLELAVAGFKKEDVSMEVHQGLLTIKGEKNSETESSYQYRGIARRAFSKSFRIAEYFEVTEAGLEDGILTVRFVKNMPEEAKPKLIAIK
jgi:molecular chaperone IbpA